MRARICSRENPSQRYDWPTSQAAILPNIEPTAETDEMPSIHHKDSGRSNILVLVEVEGGLVQNVSLLNQSAQPVLVLVRDYDNLKVDPNDYQDAEWLLG